MEEDHVHCMSCVNQRCMVRPQPGISCDLITCPLVCGAVFHSCKVDEHHLLCALLRVPCLNSGYGCPAALVRNQMYAHLEVCPAGVVCCTMEWNRWPVSCLDYTSYESLSRGVEEVEQLDMALALQDQRTLLESLKVIAMTPTAEGEALSPPREDNRTTDSSLLPSAPEASAMTESPSRAPSSRQPRPPPRGSAKERIVSGINGLTEEHFSKLYEATVETARSLSAALDFVSRAQPVDGSDERIERRSSDDGDLRRGPGGLKRKETEGKRVCSSCLRGNGAVAGADVKTLKTTDGALSGGAEACLETARPAEVKGDMSAGVSQEAAPPPPEDVSSARQPGCGAAGCSCGPGRQGARSFGKPRARAKVLQLQFVSGSWPMSVTQRAGWFHPRQVCVQITTQNGRQGGRHFGSGAGGRPHGPRRD